MDVRKTNRKLFNMVVAMGIVGTLVCANVLYTMGTHKHIWSQEDVLTGKLASSIVDTPVEARRGEILDRSYTVIAQEVNAYTIVAYLDDSVTDKNGDPDYVQDPQKTAKELVGYLDGADEKTIASILEKAIKNGQVQTELGTGTKRLSKDVKEKIEAANIPGIGFVETTNRNYPTTPYSSNMVGFAAFDEDEQTIKGRMGLELTMEDYLAGTNGRIKYQQTVDGTVLPGTTQVYEEAVDGSNVVLTIDSNLQSIVEAQLQRTMTENEAQSAWAIVMEPETGKILAWGSYPTYDQNTHQEIPSFIDNVADKNIEVGSVMKPFTYAVAIDTGVYDGSATYRAGTFTYTQDASGKIIRVANGTQTEFKPIGDALGNDFGVISFDQGLWYSSNVGICELLANYVNYNQYVDYLDKFGFFKATEIPFVTEALGMKNVGSASDYLSTGFGQASSMTLLQLCQAYTAIFNDGNMMRPYVVESIEDPETGQALKKYEPEVVGQPISEETAHKVTELMKGVAQDGYTGDRFRIDGVDMAIKTGTGELYNEQTGEYDKTNYTSSVMAAVPADDPKIMVYWGMVSANISGYSPEPFQEIMKAALIANGISGASGQQASQDSEQPEEGWDTYTMPSLINHSRTYMDQALAGKNLQVTVLGDGSSVVNQYPSEGSRINSNSRVLVLTDSAGITMPDMTGWTRKDITAFWALTGIGVQTSGYGKVQTQNIEPGTPIDTGSDVQVVME